MNQPRSDNQLGDYVRAQREANGWSGQALAQLAGIDRSALNRIERGETTQPSPRVLLAIARALEIDVTDLYLQAGFAPGTELPSVAPYLRAKFGLPDDAVRHIAEIVDMYNERYGRKETDDDTDAAA